MKTLRFTIVFASLAICLFSSTLVAQTKNNDSYVRAQLARLLEYSDIQDQGIVNLSFNLKNNHIQINKVESGKPELDKAVATYLQNRYLKQSSDNSSFKIRINLNGGNVENSGSSDVYAVQEALNDVFAQTSIREKGEATILFKVNKFKQLELIQVESQNPVLTSRIKSSIDKSVLDIQGDTKGQYAIKVKF